MNRKPSKTAAFLIIFLTISASSACSVKRLDSGKYHSAKNKNTRLSMFRDLNFNEFGLPVFENPLLKKPENRIDAYHLLILEKNLVIKSLHIGVADDRNFDAAKPVQAVYKWTGRGFETGLNISKRLIKSGSGNNLISTGRTAGTVIILAAPIVAAGTAGLLIGIIDGTRITVKDLAKILKNGHEYLLGYTEYLYDDLERLTEYRIYPPEDKGKILVRARFFYRIDSKKPHLMRIKSINEKDEKLIKFDSL